ncbi:MAG: MmgE/PrpD family protein [Burkholderiaceae bacterium]|nr:MmgE/PrpD family protein [Burkholderiaceae bacterium]
MADTPISSPATDAANSEPAFTAALAQWISGLNDEAISPSAWEWSKHVLLDWLAVGLAGASEPLVQMLLAEYGGGAEQPCTLLGSPMRARPHDAALINGAAGHALDFDDVASRMVGHPTAPVAPAALALAQTLGANGRDLLRALIVGHEIESRIGEVAGLSHYQLGFHVTGTIGTFGAAAACARLRGLDAATTRHALGLAATQAAGLKSMFGTMAKPLHAGKAAMNGLMAAQLASRGFTAHESAIECAQGFARTQAPSLNPMSTVIDTRAGFAIESALFKYHASCYLTHSTIEAIRQARARHGVTLDALDSMTVTVAGNHRGVCDIANPQTGLNVKFSIQHLAALALDGADTAALGLYTDQTARDERYAKARARIALNVVSAPDRDTAVVSMRLRDGREVTEQANVAIAAKDVGAQWTRLVGKARSIVTPVIGSQRFEAMVAAVQTLDRSTSLQPLLAALQ